jgi:hypothetical protein
LYIRNRSKSKIQAHSVRNRTQPELRSRPKMGGQIRPEQPCRDSFAGLTLHRVARSLTRSGHWSSLAIRLRGLSAPGPSA